MAWTSTHERPMQPSVASESALPAGIDAAECRRILTASGRPALLSHLKAVGVDKIGVRQKIANAVGHMTRTEGMIAQDALRQRRLDAASLPLVFIHIGYQSYFEAAVRASASVHRPVIVIGDESVAALANVVGVQWVDIAPQRNDSAIADYRHSYVHLSSNGAAFE